MGQPGGGADLRPAGMPAVLFRQQQLPAPERAKRSSARPLGGGKRRFAQPSGLRGVLHGGRIGTGPSSHHKQKTTSRRSTGQTGNGDHEGHPLMRPALRAQDCLIACFDDACLTIIWR
jgi:hypothetical protein